MDHLGWRTRWPGRHDTIAVPAATISYVVDPALRRHGYCTAMVAAVLAMPELAHIRLFTAGVEPANTASVRCVLKAGFHPLDPQPDWEGVVCYALLRSPVQPGNGGRLPPDQRRRTE